jgi:hypothetical protein
MMLHPTGLSVEFLSVLRARASLMAATKKKPTGPASERCAAPHASRLVPLGKNEVFPGSCKGYHGVQVLLLQGPIC